MGKRRAYDDELLLKAVIQYSDLVDGMIVAEELAAWSRINVPGLEYVEGRHFIRGIERVSADGQKVLVQRPSAVRIKQINADRKNYATIKRNSLLHASDVEEFFNLNRREQRENILSTRKTVSELLIQNEKLKQQVIIMEEKMSAIYEQEKVIIENQERIKRYMGSLLNKIDDEKRKLIYKSIGIGDGALSIDEIVKSFPIDDGNMFDIGKAISDSERNGREVSRIIKSFTDSFAEECL